MAELLRRNMIAALAPQGAPNMDIVVTDIQGHTLSAIQVKTRQAKGFDGGWHMSLKHENLVSAKLYYIFVDLGLNAVEEPKFWIVPSRKVAEVTRLCHQAWLTRPGKNGNVRKDSNLRRFLPDYTKTFFLTQVPILWDGWTSFMILGIGCSDKDELDATYIITYIVFMKTLSSTDLRKNLSEMMDKVNDDHEPVIITRAKGRPAVLISLEDYAAMDETTYLLSSPPNRAALERSLKDAKSGKMVEKTLDELLALEGE